MTRTLIMMIAMAATLLPVTAQAGLKIGVVNIQRAVGETKEGKQAEDAKEAPEKKEGEPAADEAKDQSDAKKDERPKTAQKKERKKKIAAEDVARKTAEAERHLEEIKYWTERIDEQKQAESSLIEVQFDYGVGRIQVSDCS